MSERRRAGSLLASAWRVHSECERLGLGCLLDTCNSRRVPQGGAGAAVSVPEHDLGEAAAHPVRELTSIPERLRPIRDFDGSGCSIKRSRRLWRLVANA